MESYKKVFALAMQNQVRHVVFHYSQLQFEPEEIPQKQKNAYWVMKKLTDMAANTKVNFDIKNLCRQKHAVHLFLDEQ